MTGDIAIIGAGRIGVPWAAVLAAGHGQNVTCVDIDEERVQTIQKGDAPFDEPKLDEFLSRAVESNRLTATTNPDAITECRYVAITVNAQRNRMADFLDIVREYANYFDESQAIINRVTLPVDVIREMKRVIDESVDGSPSFVVFPERLAEGKAIDEIQALPKIIGVGDGDGKAAMESLLDSFEVPVRFTDIETAMFVKLIDNSYRDALFAIANQIAYTADELGLDAREAIELANFEYPRNQIPTPGTVGGKCLPKDPHFLTDERVCEQPTTPDLFNATRRTNAALSSHIVTAILRLQPAKVAILGLSYKRGVGDTYNSPAKTLAESLKSHGVSISGYDPHVDGYDDNLSATLREADVVVLAVDHAAFDGIESTINELAVDDGVVYDVWGGLDEDMLTQVYDGFGIGDT